MHKRKQLQFAALAKDASADQLQVEPKTEPIQIGDRGLPHVRSMDRLSSASGFQFGRSIQSGYHKGRMDGTHVRPDSQMVNDNNYTIRSVERVFSAFPQKKPTGKDKKKAEEEKKRLEEEEALRKLMPRNETNEQALMTAGGWQNSVNIHKKTAVGTTTTCKYEEKVGVFNKVNEEMAESSNMLPLSQYFGKKPDPAKDPFDRRVTQQLNDISFEEDSEDDFEDMRAVKRQPRTVLT